MTAVEFDDHALLGCLAGFKSLDKDTRKTVQASTRNTLAPLWSNLLAKRARYAPGHPKQDARMLGKGRVTYTVGGKGSVFAWTGRPLSGGLTDWRPLEFGANRTPQLPPAARPGRIAWAAFGPFATTATRVWFASVADAMRAVPGVEDE